MLNEKRQLRCRHSIAPFGRTRVVALRESFGEILMDDIKEVVKGKYGDAALRVISGTGSACCCGSPSSYSAADLITADLYSNQQKDELPDTAVQASLGCGNPTARAELKPGEIVLDLGSGGGIDVLLSARRVSPGGKAYGLDMTDEMLALARENQKKAGIENAEFLKGEIEKIPLPENSIDVIISNCVINLSADKDRVLQEAFRVLKPGGRLAVSDVVTRGELAPDLRKSVMLWAGCIAGALEETNTGEAGCGRIREDRCGTLQNFSREGCIRFPGGQRV